MRPHAPDRCKLQQDCDFCALQPEHGWYDKSSSNSGQSDRMVKAFLQPKALLLVAYGMDGLHVAPQVFSPLHAASSQIHHRSFTSMKLPILASC